MENKHKCERKVRESWETFNLLPQSMCSLHGNIWEIKLKFGFVRSNLCIQSINSYSVDRKMKPAAPFQTVRPENEKAQKYYNLHQHFFFFTASNNQKITWDQLLHINTPLHKKPKEKKKREKKEKKGERWRSCILFKPEQSMIHKALYAFTSPGFPCHSQRLRHFINNTDSFP